MKYLKFICCFILLLSLSIGLAGCSPKNVVEDFFEDELGIEVDKDGNVEFKDEDGNSTVVIGNADWDKKNMHGLKEPKGKLESCISSEDGSFYTFIEMSEKEAKAYISYIKDSGFIYDTFEMNDTNFTGTNEDGEIISFSYDTDSKTGSIISSKGEKPTEDSKNSGISYGTDNIKWDSSLVGGLPDPGTPLTSFSTEYGMTYYSFGNMEDYMDYVEILKDYGFDLEVSETKLDNFYMYQAINEDGDEVTYAVSEDTGSAINYFSNEN